MGPATPGRQVRVRAAVGSPQVRRQTKRIPSCSGRAFRLISTDIARSPDPALFPSQQPDCSRHRTRCFTPVQACFAYLSRGNYNVFVSEITMANVNLSGMTVEALMDLRQRVDETL